LARDGYRCVMCLRSAQGGDLRFMHIDHVVPRSKGGSSEDANLQVLCRACNLHKAASEDWSPQNRRPSKYPKRKLQSQVFAKDKDGKVTKKQ
jgi:5-methylcytosine-specific restriction endonuclease McrA